MAKQGLTITLRVDGIRETLDAFRALPKDASNELRDAAMDISRDVATAASSSGRAEGRQAALVATTVKARRDRVPVIVAGGTRKLGRNRVPAYKLLFGSEFGSSRLRQYRPHVGKGSYWFFKAVEDQQAATAKRWGEAADRIILKFGGGS